jgi:GAF domain-containing protein/CheY-like chemotaxis protein
MAGCPKEACLNLRAPVFAAAFVWQAAAQPFLPLNRLNERRPPDYTPVHAGEHVRVRGTVSAGPFFFPTYTVLTIEENGFGAPLETLGSQDVHLEGFRPGDVLEASGTVSSLAGMVTVLIDAVIVTAHHPPPAAGDVPLRDLLDFRYLGRLVRTRGSIQAIGDTVSGSSVTIGQNGVTYRLFLPRAADRPQPGLSGMSIGDEVEVTGAAFQYVPRLPYNRGFELLVANPSDIVLLSRSWSVPPLVVAGLMALLLAVGLALFGREQRLKRQRERLRKTYHLGEEILGASSAEAILKRIEEVLPGILAVTRVYLYVHNRAAKTLEAVSEETGAAPSISLQNPPPGPEAGAVACMHYRTLLVVPDIERSPFPIARASGQRMPKSLLFVPMISQGEVLGVLELDQDDRKRDFPADEQALAQHLANQIAVALRLLDQRSVQEQLFRTEKMAAVGRLISGFVDELKSPLASIADLATRALDRAHGPIDRELAALAAEARKAEIMIVRLVSFASAEQVARPVSVTTLLRNLIEFREGDWKASGIRLRNLVSRDPLFVLGSEGQLEQVFLNLLVHAEQSLQESAEKTITIRTGVLAKRLIVEIVFTATPESLKPQGAAAVLGVTRSVIAGHGGEVRLIEKNYAEPRFEVELPLSSKERVGVQAVSGSGDAAAPEAGRRGTALVIEPEEISQRQLVALLSARGYRVVPVDNADTGLELAQRMRFDAAFCSVHAPGLNWVELSERLQPRVGGFILLSDGYDSELSADFEADGQFVLPKPFQESELARILRSIERPPSAKVIPIKGDVA